jgi:hypothetical protein
LAPAVPIVANASKPRTPVESGLAGSSIRSTSVPLLATVIDTMRSASG